jgi:hypothetical protein
MNVNDRVRGGVASAVAICAKRYLVSLVYHTPQVPVNGKTVHLGTSLHVSRTYQELTHNETSPRTLRCHKWS